MKKSIFAIGIISLLIATAFSGCIEKEEIKEEIKPKEIVIAPKEVLRGIEDTFVNTFIRKSGETDVYSIYDVEFIGGRNATIKGTLLIPYNPNGAGIIPIHSMGGERSIFSIMRFVEVGYIALAFDLRGHGESEGYFSWKHMLVDASKEISILEELLNNLMELNKNLPGKGSIGILSEAQGNQLGIWTSLSNPRVKAIVTTGALITSGDEEIGLLLRPHLLFIYLKDTISHYLKAGRETGILSLNIPKALINLIHFMLCQTDSCRYTLLEYAASINVPLLWIYGENGYCTKLPKNKRIYDSIASKEKKSMVIPNVNNMFMTPEGESKAVEVLDASLEWMNKYLLG
jgi:pimeloyl-ACP methyl ester carboxylesterase